MPDYSDYQEKIKIIKSYSSAELQEKVNDFIKDRDVMMVDVKPLNMLGDYNTLMSRAILYVCTIRYLEKE